MKKSTARKLRFSFIGKMIFSNNFTDRLFRKIFVNNFTENFYKETTDNWKKINDELYDVLKKHNCFLGHGAALSIIRDNKIKFNQDLDYDIYEKESYDDFIVDLEKLGYKMTCKLFNKEKLVMMTFKKNGAYVDFFVISEDEKYGWNIQTASYERITNKFIKDGDFWLSQKSISYLRRVSLPSIVEKTIDDSKVLLPKEYDIYFTELYGSDWTTPKRYFNWAINPKNNKPIKIKKNLKHYVSDEAIKCYFNKG